MLRAQICCSFNTFFCNCSGHYGRPSYLRHYQPHLFITYTLLTSNILRSTYHEGHLFACLRLSKDQDDTYEKDEKRCCQHSQDPGLQSKNGLSIMCSKCTHDTHYNCCRRRTCIHQYLCANQSVMWEHRISINSMLQVP